MPIPSGVEAGTGAVDGDGTLAVSDADYASAMPADDGAAQSRWVSPDTEAGAAATAVPVRGGSAGMGSIQSDSLKGVAQELCNVRESTGFLGLSDLTLVPRHISAVTGAEVGSRSIPMSSPLAAQPSGRASSECLREDTAFAALPYACSFEGKTVPSSVEEVLLQAPEWEHQVGHLKKAVVTLREASTAAESECVLHHEKLRAVQDVLAVVIQRLAAPPMSSSTFRASRPTPEDFEAAPPAKRTCYS